MTASPELDPQAAQPGGVEAQLRDQGLRRVQPGQLVGQLGVGAGRSGENRPVESSTQARPSLLPDSTIAAR